MTALTQETLLRARRQYFVDAQGGTALPAAGAVYWIVLAIGGMTMEAKDWGLLAAMLSGAIFPVAVLLQWPLRSRFMKAKSPVSGAGWAAIIAINFLWPVHVVIISIVPEAAPLSLAIGMTLHWPVIGWMYASKVCYLHAVARLAVVTLLWYGFPELRLTGLPLAVAALYLLAAWGLALESGWARRWLGRETGEMHGQAQPA